MYTSRDQSICWHGIQTCSKTLLLLAMLNLESSYAGARTICNRVRGMMAKLTRPNVIVISILVLFLTFILLLYTLRFAFNRRGIKTVINILCFGDSLTAGSYTLWSERIPVSKRHPYSIALQKHFDVRDRTVEGETGKAEINGRRIYKVHTAGIPGERAVDEMLRRLKEHLRNSTISYHWVVILGGTNDLRKYFNDPSLMEDYTSIFKALVKLHETVAKSGGRTVAVTIPDRECIGAGTCDNIKKLQYQINEHLRDYALQNKDKVILADLAKEIVLPRDSELFSDWVHLNPRGYNKMADVIYTAMKDYV